MAATDVVIGAASGMGEATARRLAERGNRLVVADLDLAGVEGLAAELGDGAEAHRCDLTDAGGIAALADACGEVGSVVLTAGISPTMAPGRTVLAVDLVGPALVLDAFLPRVGPGSAVVVLASMAGHLVPPDPAVDAVLDAPLADTLLDDLAAAGVDVDEPGTAYGYAKRGLIRLARHRAPAFGQRGARLVSLSPGIVDTPMGRQEDEAQPLMADMVAGSPLGRMVEADEVAAVIEFLVSGAASAVTGVDVLVDGGQTGPLLG